MRTRIFCRATVAVLAGLCLVAGGAAVPDDPKADAYEPKARALLEEVAKVYQGMSAYVDHGSLRGELTLAKRVGSSVQLGQTQRTTKRSLAFVRPNKLRIQLDNITVYCDGKKVTSVLIPPKKYAEAPVPARVDTQELVKVAGARAPVALAFAADGALATAVVLDLLVSPDPVKSVLDGTDGLKLEPDRDVNGHNRKSLYVDQTEGPDIRMLVDPETKRIDIIELVYDLKGVNSEQPRERQFQEVTLVWRAGDVSTQVPDETFQFKPPPDFEKVEATAEAPGAEDPKDEKPADKGKKADGGAAGKDKNAEAAAEEPSPVEKFVGKPAPDFTLTVLDSEGKTKKVTKADLAGKVVLIDFWATWCPPCIKELPEIQKLVDLLGDVKDDVAVVALSEDAEPTDLPGLRTLVEKSLKENSVKLAEGPVSMVAIDLEGKVGNSFKVDGLPTLVLIDPKGTVQAVHVGFTEHADVVLGEQIVALLQGKTLTKPGDTPKP